MAANLRARLARIREQTGPGDRPVRAASSIEKKGPEPGFPPGWTPLEGGVRFKETVSTPSLNPPDIPLCLAAFSRRLPAACVDWTELAFFDLETTGLSGGSGTVAFLAGLGRWRKDGSFSVKQYFMDDYPAEPLFLSCLENELSTAKAVVTYNGASFDMPLLAVRRAMNGLRPDGSAPHLDALHAARRLWRRSVAACSLSVLECSVLGIARSDDIPGAEVPDVWFQYLKKGDTARLASVFEHNAQDVESLAMLSAVIHGATLGRGSPLACDVIGLAELQARFDPARAESSLVRAMDAGESRAVRPLMRLYVQQNRQEERAALVPRLPDDAAGLYSKSVYAERRLGDLTMALDCIMRAIDLSSGKRADMATRRARRLRARLIKEGRGQADSL